MPQPHIPGKVLKAGLFSPDTDLFAIPEFENQDIISYTFDPLSTFLDNDIRRYDAYLNELNDRREDYTGTRIDLDQLPIITREINHSDPEMRKKNGRYYFFRDLVKKQANKSSVFRSVLPDYKKEKLYDDFTHETYGLYQTMAKMLPPKGTDERTRAKDAMLQVFKDEWKQRMAKTITYAADEYAKGWNGDIGDAELMAGQSFKSIIGSSMQANEDLYGKMAVGLMKMDSWTKSIISGDYSKPQYGTDSETERTVKSFGESYRRIGRGMEIEAKDVMEALNSPSGKYLESGANLPWLDGYLNPAYMYLKLVENAPNHGMTTALGVGSALGAASLTAGGPPGVVAAGTAFSQIPSLMANFALETGDMYASARDYLYELREDATKYKGRMSEDRFNQKYSYNLSKDVSRTADKLTDDDIHEISKDLAKLYGWISTGIEGATNIVTVNKWLKGYGKGIAGGMATKEGKQILGRKAVEKFGKEIGKWKGGTVKSVLTGIGMEALQEFLQEGTGEVMKANAMPGYKFDISVPLDAAYSGGLFGGVTYTAMGTYRNVRAKRMDKLWQKAVDAGALDQSQVAQRSATQIDAILKAALITSNDIESVVKGLSSDPDNQASLEQRAYELIVRGNLFSSDPQELTNELVANREAIESALGLTVDNLVNADVEFNDKQIADILGNEYTETTADLATSGQEGVDLTAPPLDPTFEDHTNLGKDDAGVLMQIERVENLKKVLVRAEKEPLPGESTEDYNERLGNINENLKNEEQKLNELQGALPNPKGDPDSIKTQSILDNANEIPNSEWTDEERKVINAIRRKNASEERYDAARNLIVNKKKAYKEKLEQQRIEKEEEIKKQVAKATRASGKQDTELVEKLPLRSDQPEKLKRGYKWYAISTENKETKERGVSKVQGKEVDLGTVEDATHFIYKEDGLWIVSNEQTGSALGGAKTQAEAISVVKDKISDLSEKKGPDALRAIIKEKYSKEFGEAVGIAKPELDIKGVSVKPEDVHAVAKDEGIDIESNEFKEFSKKITGKEHIDDMDSSERTLLMANMRTGEKPVAEEVSYTPAEVMAFEKRVQTDMKALTDLGIPELEGLYKALGGMPVNDFRTNLRKTIDSRISRLAERGTVPTEVKRPMSEKDAEIIAKNITSVVIDETHGDKDWSMHEADLRALAYDDPAALLHIAYQKGIPDLTRFTDENDQLDLKKGSDLINEIVGLEARKDLYGGVGAFPLIQRGTKQRLHRWFSRFWFDSKKRFGYDDSSFWAWANDEIAPKLPSQFRPYWIEWAEQIPKELSAVDTLFHMIFPDQMSAFSPDNINQVVQIFKDADGKMDIVYEQDTDDSGGDIYFEGWTRLNSIAFEPLGLFLETEEVSFIKSMVNKVPDFETWLTEISKGVPLKTQEQIWEAALDPEVRRRLKTVYASHLTRNMARVNRDMTGVDGDTGENNHRINYEFKYDRRSDRIIIEANKSYIKGPSSTTRIGKLNVQWARRMHGENFLGDVKLAWMSGSDLSESVYVRDSMGDMKRDARGFFRTTDRPRYKFFSADELMELTGLQDERFDEEGRSLGKGNPHFRNENIIPLFVRGDEDQMAIVRITQNHRDAAVDKDGYWKNEDLPDNMKKEYNVEDQWLASANIARHEAMKRILGPDYHTLSAQKMMKRLKAFFTPGISVAGGPDSKIVVFDYNNAVFETVLPNGTVITRKATDNIDDKGQYIGDGMTITSERKFKKVYPRLLGTDPRAKRAKTIIGSQDVDENGVNHGAFIGKHQEMTMYVPLDGKMRVKVNGKVVAEIYSNGETTDIYVGGEYVDHLMTDKEAVIRLGNKYKNNNELITIPSEATTHVQAVGMPKNYANFPMQLMNYITDPGLLAAVNYLIANQVTSKSTRALIQKAISVGLNGDALNKFILSLGDKNGESPRRFVMAAAELGAGRHPTNQGSASVLVNSHLLRKSMSVLQDGSVLDFRPDFSNMVNDDEIILPANVPSIRKKIYQKFADAHDISMKEAKTYNLPVINKWLRENNVRVMAVRYPVPSSLGYGIFRVKSLMGSLAGDSFVVSPKNVKEKFEGDHDHDVGHISFLDEDMLDLLEQNQGVTKGIALDNYLPKGRDTMYSFSNIEDMFHLMEELSYGKRSIGEIANVQRVAGIAQNHFESITLDGSKVVLVPTNSVIIDDNSGIEDTLENILRIYAQAAFDNADYRLLSLWNYSQKNLFKLMFKNADGTELTDRQFNTLGVYINTLKLNGHIAGGGTVNGRYTLKDMFDVSEQYSLFVQDRERFMGHKMVDYLMHLSSDMRENHATVDEIRLKTGNTHPQETLTMMPSQIAEENGVDPNTLFDADEDMGKSSIAHSETWKSSVMSDQSRIQMVREVAGDMTEQQIVEEAKNGSVWAQSMMNELHKLYRKHRGGGTIDAVIGQTWDHNEEFLYFAQSWYEGKPIGEFAERLGFKPKIGFKNLSPVAQRAATYDFLAGLRMRDSEGRRMSTFNVKMIPPVSKEGVTLLDPDVMQKYFTEYNKQLDILDNIEDINNPEKFIPVGKTFTILKKEFGCV